MMHTFFARQTIRQIEKNLVLLLITLLPMCVFASCSSNAENSSDPKQEDTTEQKNEQVLLSADASLFIVEATTSNKVNPIIHWTWNTGSPKQMPANYDKSKLATIAECKPIMEGNQIAIASSSGAIAILNKEDKNVVFYAEVPNAHSIDLLPGNLVVAAASVTNNPQEGNKIMLFDLSSATLLQTHELYSAHGVVWDDKRQLLFALGGSVLRTYRIVNNQLVLNFEWTIPGKGGHDLTMAPTGDKLYLTEETGAWEFDINTKKFSKILGFPDGVHIKSLHQNEAGRFVYTKAEDSWWTYHVSFAKSAGSLAFPNKRVYKARWFTK